MVKDSELEAAYLLYSGTFLRPLIDVDDHDGFLPSELAPFDSSLTSNIENDVFLGEMDIGVEAFKDMSLEDLQGYLGNPKLTPRYPSDQVSADHPSHWQDYSLTPSHPFMDKTFHLRLHQRSGIASGIHKAFHSEPEQSGCIWTADSVGLGKTAQAIGLICQIRSYHSVFREAKANNRIMGTIPIPILSE